MEADYPHGKPWSVWVLLCCHSADCEAATCSYPHGAFGGLIEVGVEDAMPTVGRLLGVFERLVDAPEAEFSVSAQIEPLAH